MTFQVLSLLVSALKSQRLSTHVKTKSFDQRFQEKHLSEQLILPVFLRSLSFSSTMSCVFKDHHWVKVVSLCAESVDTNSLALSMLSRSSAAGKRRSDVAAVYSAPVYFTGSLCLHQMFL